MHALIRELIVLYTGLLQLHGHVMPATRNGECVRDARTLEA
ncbi:MAG TPA: hypothetical protein VFS55_01200 [Dokdonella sp.]|nr:hypothetical protein [Dokdonella sp.]